MRCCTAWAHHSGALSKSKPFGIYVGRCRTPFWPLIHCGLPEEKAMLARLIHSCLVILFACVVWASSAVPGAAGSDGIVRVKSAHPIGETIERLKKDIADKGIKFFDEIDQSKLAADAGVKLHASVLLVFGNPPLGTQFITANANAGLDWPVRLLVFENDKG